MNPLFVLPQLVDEENESATSVFSPTVITDYKNIIAKMKKNDDASDERLATEVTQFVKAVVNGNVAKASALIVPIYRDKPLLVKTLLETAMDHIAVEKVLVINTVFKLAEEEMNPVKTIIAVRLLCQGRKTNTPYNTTYHATGSISDMILDARDKCNEYYWKLQYCDEKYWTYPIYLSAYAKENTGTHFAAVEKSAVDEKRAEILKDVVS